MLDVQKKKNLKVAIARDSFTEQNQHLAELLKLEHRDKMQKLFNVTEMAELAEVRAQLKLLTDLIRLTTGDSKWNFDGDTDE